jgi:uncharacterized membrane protein
MGLHPEALWQRLQSTFWFTPAVVTLAAIGLAVGFTQLDRYVPEAAAFGGYVYSGGPEGARAVLSALAGSMITVVSVTFSVTVVALTVASQHFGPRLLSNFMRDKAAQLVLGTFIGTFAYSLIVLRTVRGESDQISAFVPHLAVTGAMLLALTSVAMLIYYVHHVSASIQVSEITAGVTHELEKAIERLYPERVGQALGETGTVPSVPAAALDVRASGSGYLQSIEANGLLALAAGNKTTIWLQARPGDFVTDSGIIARAWPVPEDPKTFGRQLNDTLVLGAERSSHQDAGFPVQQLVEVALHALSPGINEPFTAITCVDRLGQGLALLATRAEPSPLRADDSGQLRIVATPTRFVDLLSAAFDPIRHYAAVEPLVARHILEVLARIADQVVRAGDREAVREQGRLLAEAAERALSSAHDVQRIRMGAARLAQAVGHHSQGM